MESYLLRESDPSPRRPPFALSPPVLAFGRHHQHREHQPEGTTYGAARRGLFPCCCRPPDRDRLVFVGPLHGGEAEASILKLLERRRLFVLTCCPTVAPDTVSLGQHSCRAPCCGRTKSEVKWESEAPHRICRLTSETSCSRKVGDILVCSGGSRLVHLRHSTLLGWISTTVSVLTLLANRNGK
jgi:hypothetical protein